MAAASTLRTGEALSAKPIFGPDFEPHSGVIHKSQFCWKAASGIWLLWNKDCQDSSPPRSPFFCRCARTAFFLVGMTATCSPPRLRAHPKTPNHMAQQRNPPGAHLEPTLHCMGEREEPTRSPPGTHRQPTGNPAGTRMGERKEPTRSPQEPTGNPPGTHPKPHLKSAGAHLLPTRVYNTFCSGEKGCGGKHRDPF